MGQGPIFGSVPYETLTGPSVTAVSLSVIVRVMVP